MRVNLVKYEVLHKSSPFRTQGLLGCFVQFLGGIGVLLTFRCFLAPQLSKLSPSVQLFSALYCGANSTCDGILNSDKSCLRNDVLLWIQHGSITS